MQREENGNVVPGGVMTPKTKKNKKILIIIIKYKTNVREIHVVTGSYARSDQG